MGNNQTHIANASDNTVTVEIRHSGIIESRTISSREDQVVHTNGQQVILTLIGYAGKRCLPFKLTVDADRSVLVRPGKTGQLEIVRVVYGKVWVAE